MSKLNMHRIFLIPLWELTKGGEKDRQSFIQEALKLFKRFKVPRDPKVDRGSKRPKLHVLPKKTSYNLFYNYMQEKNKS